MHCGVKNTMSETLTSIQNKILQFIIKFQRLQGFSPSCQEITGYCGFASPRSTTEHLKRLRKKNYVDWIPRKARSLRVKIDFLEYAIPLVGYVGLGKPILETDNYQDYLDLSTLFPQNGKKFGLRIKGDSMNGVGIFDQDIVIVHQQSNVKHGEIAAIRLNHELTIKRVFYKSDSQIILRSENPAFNPLYFSLKDSQVEILGKVIGLLREAVK